MHQYCWRPGPNDRALAALPYPPIVVGEQSFWVTYTQIVRHNNCVICVATLTGLIRHCRSCYVVLNSVFSENTKLNMKWWIISPNRLKNVWVMNNLTRCIRNHQKFIILKNAPTTHKSVCGWGFAPDPAGKPIGVPPHPIADTVGGACKIQGIRRPWWRPTGCSSIHLIT
jgi:hypothetical protein